MSNGDHKRFVADVLRRVAANNPKYQLHADRAAGTAPLALPCIHQGSSAPPPPGRDVRKEWIHCDAGFGVVCKCLNCGCLCNESCPGYVAESDE